VDTGLPDGNCDLAFLGNIWHELDEPGTVLAELRRYTASRRRVAILDWRAGVPYPPGPPPEHRVAPSETEARLNGDDWRNVSFATWGYSYLWLPGGIDPHYVLGSSHPAGRPAAHQAGHTDGAFRTISTTGAFSSVA